MYVCIVRLFKYEGDKMSFGNIILLILVAIIGYFIIIYNKFVSLRAGMDASWSDIDVQLKRRYNLIPALVDTVRGYKNYEASTLEDVIRARQQGVDASTVKDQEQAENIISAALGKLFALAEAYPDLKANTTFLKLQNELSNIEEEIQSARRYYNAIVRDNNAKTESFPDLFIARKYNFEKRDYFELDEDESAAVQKMPKIDL